MKNSSLGTLWNSVAGILGDGLGGSILGMIGLGTDGGMDVSRILGNIAGGGVMAVIGLIKKAMNK